jgi:hypothetical protein
MPTANVRMASPAAEALRALPADQATAVAAAISRIGRDEGVPFELPGQDGPQYTVMIPDNDHAPVVIYTQPPKLEGGGYRVTGLLDRDAYNAYTRSDEPGFFETAAGKALIGLGALAVVYGLTRGSGKSSPSS